jgi:hypothetical protein
VHFIRDSIDDREYVYLTIAKFDRLFAVNSKSIFVGPDGRARARTFSAGTI